MDSPIPKECYLEWRIKTFKNWHFDNTNSPCNSIKLAEAGFYRTNPTTDALKCFMCLKELDGWDSHDSPMDEHIKHAPYCPFLKMGLYENFTGDQLCRAEVVRILCHQYINDNADIDSCIDHVSESQNNFENCDKAKVAKPKRAKK